MLAHAWLPLVLASAAFSGQDPAPAAEPTGDFVVHERLAYRDRVERDGTQTRIVEARALLRNATAVAQYGQLGWPYVDSLGEVAFEAVVIQKPDGRTVEVKDGLLEDVSPFGVTGTQIAADVRFKKLTIPGLEPGDRLSYRLIYRQQPLAAGRAFGELKLTPALGDPVQTYELDVPRAGGVRVRLREGLGSEWEEMPSPPDRQVRRLSLTVPRPRPEELKELTRKKLEQWAEPDVIFTTFSSWDEVAHWWWDLSRDRLEPDAGVRTQAESLGVAGLPPPQALERLHAFVASGIRYLNVNFGVGRMQPRPAPQVLTNRYGDCKDKHALLAALAATVGIDVRPVLIHSTRPDLRDDVPAPQQFDHMVSVARLGPDPADWLWLDGTDRFGVPGALAAGLRDKQALLIEPSGAALIVRTPAEPPFVPRTELELKATLLDDGVLQARAVWRFRTDEEPQYRALLETIPEQQRPEVVKSWLARDWSDAKVSNVVVSDLAAVTEPLRIEFDVERPAPEGFASGDRNLWVPLPAFGLADADESAPADADELELGVREFSIRAEVRVPEGFQTRAPLSVSLDRPFGRFQSAYTVDRAHLTIARTLTLTTRRLDRGQAAAYNGFRRAIDSDRDQKFLVLGGASAASGATPAALHAQGLAAFNSRDYTKAVELITKATAADPKLKDGWLDLGRALHSAERFEDAVAAFTKQVEAAPFHESAWSWRAFSLDRLGRGEEAEKDLLKQIEVAPFEAWSYNSLGEHRTVQGRFREAADLFARALAIKPKEKGRWVDLAWAEARDGRSAEAREALAQARSLELDDWLKIKASGVYLLAGDAATAAELATEGLGEMASRSARLSSGNIGEGDLWIAEYVAKAWHVLGSAALERGDQAAAERYLAAAWQVWFLPDAGWALGTLREKQGRLDEALLYWRMADSVPISIFSLPPDRKARIEAAAARLGSPGTTASARLLELRTVSLDGPALADLGEEVLMLVGADGMVESVRSLTGQDAAAFDRQLPQLGRIRLSLTPPDGGKLRVVRRGVLACSKASSCAIVLDIPGVGSLGRLLGKAKAD